MRHHRHTAPTRHQPNVPQRAPRRDPIEAEQLRRLADAVLTKSTDDLAALAENNPMLVWEWIEAFRKQKMAAEAEARYWSAVTAALCAASPRAVGAAAE